MSWQLSIKRSYQSKPNSDSMLITNYNQFLYTEGYATVHLTSTNLYLCFPVYTIARTSYQQTYSYSRRYVPFEIWDPWKVFRRSSRIFCRSSDGLSTSSGVFYTQHSQHTGYRCGLADDQAMFRRSASKLSMWTRRNPRQEWALVSSFYTFLSGRGHQAGLPACFRLLPMCFRMLPEVFRLASACFRCASGCFRSSVYVSTLNWRIIWHRLRTTLTR